MTRATCWWAAAAVDLVVRALPREQRERYRRELRSELHGMTRWRQFAHVAGVLSRTWALRAALADSMSLRGDGDMTPSIHWFWRLVCRLNLHHDYVRVHGEDNALRHLQAVREGSLHPTGPGGGAVFGGSAAF